MDTTPETKVLLAILYVPWPITLETADKTENSTEYGIDICVGLLILLTVNVIVVEDTRDVDKKLFSVIVLVLEVPVHV